MTAVKKNGKKEVVLKVKMDLHIHTGLSPCALNEMTPNNIVNMALLNQLDVIAVTDHNSMDNVKAVMDVAQGKDVIIIPGMEVETAEEVHVLCLFSDFEQGQILARQVQESLPGRQNRPEVFGEQLRYNQVDDVVGCNTKLLSFASKISINQLVNKTRQLGGVAVPAHIDRPSYSLLSNLGDIPDCLYLKTLEISRFANLRDYHWHYSDYRFIQSSDAHELGFIGIANYWLEVEEKSAEAVVKALL